MNQENTNDLFGNLLAEAMREHKWWARSTRIYGSAYVATRVLVIVASAIVAAEKSLGGFGPEMQTKIVPVLAVIVAIATAIDTWLKPRDKWRGFMGDRDDAADLLIRVRGTPRDNTAELDKLRAEFVELRRRHRDKNVY